jgi:drug/metabolite transporter (DMT)-like permease
MRGEPKTASRLPPRTPTGRLAKRQSFVGVLAVALAAALWGTAAIFIRLSHVPPVVLTEYRLAVASGVFLVVLFSTGRRLRLGDLWTAIPGGVLLCADMACFFIAVDETRVADAAVIGALQPALVMLVARPLFHERVDRWDLGWTALAIAGVVAVVAGSGVPRGTNFRGDLIAVASLIAWTAYFLVSKRARRRAGTIEYTFWVTVVAAVVLFPFAVASGERIVVDSASSWLWIAMLALIPGTGHLLMNWAHSQVDVSVSSVIASSNPIFAAGAAWAVLGEGLDAVQLMCGLVGIGAICVVAGRTRLEAGAPLNPAVDLDGGTGSRDGSFGPPRWERDVN